MKFFLHKKEILTFNLIFKIYDKQKNILNYFVLKLIDFKNRKFIKYKINILLNNLRILKLICSRLGKSRKNTLILMDNEIIRLIFLKQKKL
jgi:hypothetical protein